MIEKIKELRKNKIYHTFTRSNDNINSITTIDTTYNLPNGFYDLINDLFDN
jgi:hypothetical protein